MSDQEHIYTSCYCEENIYHLARLFPDSYTVIISNRDRTVPFWSNKLRIDQGSEDGHIIWDYHVVLIKEDKIWDFDSAVSFPCSIREYFDRVLRTSISLHLPEQFRRQYRVIRSLDFVRDFASDRSHMLRDGQYVMPIPTYAAIIAQNGETMNLHRLIDFTTPAVPQSTATGIDGIQRGLMGTILDEAEFLDFCQKAGEL